MEVFHDHTRNFVATGATGEYFKRFSNFSETLTIIVSDGFAESTERKIKQITRIFRTLKCILLASTIDGVRLLTCDQASLSFFFAAGRYA